MEIFRVIICGNNFMDAEMDDYHFFSKRKKNTNSFIFRVRNFQHRMKFSATNFLFRKFLLQNC